MWKYSCQGGFFWAVTLQDFVFWVKNWNHFTGFHPSVNGGMATTLMLLEKIRFHSVFPVRHCRVFLFFLLPRELLKDMPEYYVPEVIEDLTSKQVLTTELIEGTSLDKIENPNQETINKVLLESCKKFDAKLALCKVITGVSIGFEVGICPALNRRQWQWRGCKLEREKQQIECKVCKGLQI